MKLRMMIGILLLTVISFGVNSKADAAPRRGGHGYHRYGNSVKYVGGYHGHHRGHGYYGCGHHYGYGHHCGGHMRGRGCRR